MLTPRQTTLTVAQSTEGPSVILTAQFDQSFPLEKMIIDREWGLITIPSGLPECWIDVARNLFRSNAIFTFTVDGSQSCLSYLLRCSSVSKIAESVAIAHKAHINAGIHLPAPAWQVVHSDNEVVILAERVFRYEASTRHLMFKSGVSDSTAWYGLTELGKSFVTKLLEQAWVEAVEFGRPNSQTSPWQPVITLAEKPSADNLHHLTSMVYAHTHVELAFG